MHATFTCFSGTEDADEEHPDWTVRLVITLGLECGLRLRVSLNLDRHSGLGGRVAHLDGHGNCTARLKTVWNLDVDLH